MSSLKYDGTTLQWIENGKVKYRFAATSGMSASVSENGRNYQNSTSQCVKDAGPIPEGSYALRLQFNNRLIAEVADPQTCQLKAATGIQQIPDADKENGTEDCTPYWQNWGQNRVRIDAYDSVARRACNGNRGGFYIHDSSKGFTHGCIEVEHAFFKHLYDLVNSQPAEKFMILLVNYGQNASTRGLTLRP